MFINEVIDSYMHCIMQKFYLKNAQICKYSLADLNIDHCVALTFLEGKLGRFLMLLSNFGLLLTCFFVLDFFISLMCV